MKILRALSSFATCAILASGLACFVPDDPPPSIPPSDDFARPLPAPLPSPSLPRPSSVNPEHLRGAIGPLAAYDATEVLGTATPSGSLDLIQLRSLDTNTGDEVSLSLQFTGGLWSPDLTASSVVIHDNANPPPAGRAWVRVFARVSPSSGGPDASLWSDSVVLRVSDGPAANARRVEYTAYFTWNGERQTLDGAFVALAP